NAQSSSTAALDALALRGDLSLITGGGGNVVVLSDSHAAALVDTGSVEHAASLASLVSRTTSGVPVELILNTHWHEDHTGGNDLYGGDSAPRIVAHENTRLWMSTEYYVDWEGRTYVPRASAALPNDTFFSSDTQPIVIGHGAESIEYAHLPEAHTDGDIYVLFREHNVIATGGACTAGEYPVPDYATGGWIGGLIDATSKLLDIADGDTLIVPAHGPVQTREHLYRQREMLVAVRERMEELMRAGRSAPEMLAAGVTDAFDAQWRNNRERFVSNVYGGLWWVGRLTNSL
ncbi:MAG TPA: MBL fold metallo-hydrolase, partial [Gammaproteobacteria bacterium]|nr:MBL fold metallo-hydrolase [Gammaproteobacteria bacterium]